MFKNRKFDSTHSIWFTLTNAYEVMNEERTGSVSVTGAHSPVDMSSEENDFGSYFLPADYNVGLPEQRPSFPPLQQRKRRFDFSFSSSSSSNAAPISDKTRSGSPPASPRNILSPASAPEGDSSPTENRRLLGPRRSSYS